ncbi:MAG: DUF2062 domain-containing protein [Deltaproteobacteria bacterium]|nr:DUF2062 domain-containing protein [Deltaproteobacteria bacterium]
MNKEQEKASFKERFKGFLTHLRDLQGDPQYIAMGMAIGVFIAFTPTIPFHTVLALCLAFILKGSKPAAAIGVWLSNPVTIPVLYYGSFKIGRLLLRKPLPYDVHLESIRALFGLGLDVTLAMLLGGAILGIIPAIIAYLATYRIIGNLRKRSQRKKEGEDAEPEVTGQWSGAECLKPGGNGRTKAEGKSA